VCVVPGVLDRAATTVEALLGPHWMISNFTANIALPGSQRYRSTAELPADPLGHTVAFEAPAGSIVAMDGRGWHTSGANTTTDEERALLFGYCWLDFLRPQVNGNVIHSPATQASLSLALFARLGLGAAANVRIGGVASRRQERDRTLAKRPQNLLVHCHQAYIEVCGQGDVLTVVS